MSPKSAAKVLAKHDFSRFGMCLPLEKLLEIWYNIVRYYTSADLRPTRGRTISLANHAHPPEGEGINALSMSGEHSIMSSDIIPASVRRPTCGRKFHSKLYASPKGNMDEGNCRGMEGDIKTRGRIISHGGE